LVLWLISLAWLPHLPLSAESPWIPVGPLGGDIQGLAVNPTNPSEMYAAVSASPSRIYKSDDAGQTWSLKALLNTRLYHAAVAPSNPNIVYALGVLSVYKSTDRGATWKEYPLGASRNGYYGEIVVSRTNPALVYACGYYSYSAGNFCPAVFKSVDGAASWSVKALSSSSTSGYANALALDPGNDGVLYVGGYDSDGSKATMRVFKSINGGDSWAEISGSIEGYPGSIAVDGNNTSRVYVATSWGVFRSENGGQTWAKNSGIVYAYAVAIDPANSNNLFAGYTAACYKSTDGGINWTQSSAGLYGNCSNLLFAPSLVYYASTTGIYKSSDGGVTWQASYSGISAAQVPALAVASSSPNVLYAEVQGDGFFKSDSFGLSWQRLPDFYRCDAVRKIAVNPGDADSLFVLSGG
jgi:photosystem II stability/assembly factor-like uncharacterized protein